MSTVLFTLYTNDCTGTENTIFIKYSDDTAIVDLSSFIPHYTDKVQRFTTWCKDNFLDLNVTKTKELLIDCRKQPPAVSPITIDGEIVERVEKCKYLGIILYNKLKFDSNVVSIYKMSLKNLLLTKAEEHWHELKHSSIILPIMC